jgi:hypothetical protein
MKKTNGLYAGITETDNVEEFLNTFHHPMEDAVHYLRKIILSCDKKIGQGIYWNAPIFYYTGEMETFNPKEYKRYIVGFNFFKQDCLRLIFLFGDKLPDPEALLEGNYKDGRRLITFTSIQDVKNKEQLFKKLVKACIAQI